MNAGGGRAARGRTVAPLRGVGAGAGIVPQPGAGPSAVISLGRKSRKENCRQQRDRVASIRAGYFVRIGGYFA